MIIDDHGDTIEVPITEVVPLKLNKDGSATFRMFGGPFHGMIIRIYNDKGRAYERVVLEHKGEQCVYKILPPLKGSRAKWVYAYDPSDTTPLTEQELGEPIDPDAQQRWMNYLAFKRQKELEEYEAGRIVWEGESNAEDFEAE